MTDEEKYKPVNEIWNELLTNWSRDIPRNAEAHRVAVFTDHWESVYGGWPTEAEAQTYASWINENKIHDPGTEAYAYFGVERQTFDE